MTRERLKSLLFGKPLDPLKLSSTRHMALVTLMAWIGLGADGISSSCYGPEEAFLALGEHTQLAIFLALTTGITVFLISIAYLQVIELFPNGGGGYRVATTLISPTAGLVSGSALIVDYILTIAISTAGGVDALFSIVSHGMQPYKIPVEIALVGLLTYLNLRGMKESVKVLMPIFLGFIFTHGFIVLYGISVHSSGLGNIVPEAISETGQTAQEIGWVALLALFFKAFSLGGGTYTGLEAVSNSLHSLAEPKVKTGKRTMMIVAASLAFMAMGIILLYLLWGVQKQPGQTLNATAFTAITKDWSINGTNISGYAVATLMLLEAGLLFVAANTGFLAGPSVLASMAVDRWMPHQFSALSSRLVTKNGVLLMGICSVLALLITRGQVGLLVVLYSINVFITFTLSLLGLCRHQWRQRNLKKLLVPLPALFVCASILATTLFEKFATGGWITVLVTSVIILCGLLIRRNYMRVQHYLERTEEELIVQAGTLPRSEDTYPVFDHNRPTAVFLINETSACGIHMLNWVQKNFPGIFVNFIFTCVGEIDTEEFIDERKWDELRRDTRERLKRYVDYCTARGLASRSFHTFSTDALQGLTELTQSVSAEFLHPVFFSVRVISDNENFMTQLLHNQTTYILQRRLHNVQKALIICPIKLESAVI